MAVDLPLFDVFLSHNSQDKAVVAEIGRRLQARGLTPWLDVWELLPGQRWQKGLAEGLARSKAVAVFLGASGLGPWQEPEMEAVLDRSMRDGCPVIPVLLPGSPERPELPTFLSLFVWVDLRTGLEEAGLDRLVAGLRRSEDSPARSGTRPQPSIMDPSTAELVKERNALERQLAEERATGADVAKTAAQLVEVKRRLRAGGRLRAGDRLDGERYELLEHIGKGGFGHVWKAWDEIRRELVAIKVLDDHGGHGGQRKERFFRGARQMAWLDHPGIVKVLESMKEDDGWAFFVMEYLQGGDLHGAVLEKRLTRNQGLQAVLEAGEALAHAHAKGLVHRDVKPHNILLTAEGRAKLTNFDLVRALDTSGGTASQAGVGTFLYMAPEAMNAAKSAGAAADVYSLAMTACFVLHGGELPPEALVARLEFLSKLGCAEPVRAALEWGTEHPEAKRANSVASFLGRMSESLGPLRVEVLSCEPSPATGKGPWSIEGEDEFGRWAAFEVKGVEHRLRWIPPGRFQMGSLREEEGHTDSESPRHEVELTRGFWLGEVPCTQVLWQAVMGWNPSGFMGPSRPVESVSWEDCQRFLQTLKLEVPGEAFRLPTEAEWEYAARAGTETARYQREIGAVAWYGDNSAGGTRPVGHKSANLWGLHDMLGNVWEWCHDFTATYSSQFQRDPSGPMSGTYKVIRGGSWSDHAQFVRAAARIWRAPSYRLDYLGFRLARDQVASRSSE